MILLICPANSHEVILKSIAPYVESGVLIGATPAPGGFNMLARYILAEYGGKQSDEYTIFGMGCLPWVCRINEWGKSVNLAGTKKYDDVTVLPESQTDNVLKILNFLYVDTKMNSNGNFLHTTFFPTNCIIHPGISMGIWNDYNGESIKEAPLFYQNMNDFTAEIIDGLSNDIQQTCKKAEERLQVKLDVPTIQQFMLNVYPDDILDKSSTQKLFATNRQFNGLRAPVIPHSSGVGYQPNFHFRYLTEDLPHGLAVMRGIAEILQVSTPFFDKVLSWGQDKINHEYLVNGKIQGKDIFHSGCPQRFGIHTVEDLKQSLE
jgi:hypothetical protein